MPWYNMSRFVPLFRYRDDLVQTQSIINSYIQRTTLSKFKDFLYLGYKTKLKALSTPTYKEQLYPSLKTFFISDTRLILRD